MLVEIHPALIFCCVYLIPCTVFFNLLSKLLFLLFLLNKTQQSTLNSGVKKTT
jgi:hypothetical protein